MIIPDRKIIEDPRMAEEIANSSGVDGAQPEDLQGNASVKKSSLAFIESAIKGSTQQDTLDTKTISFVLWILAALDENIITARTVIRARDVLERQMMNYYSNEEIEDFASKLGLNLRIEGDQAYSIDVFSFARYASRISGESYRLANQIVVNGRVILEKRVLTKILREAFVAFMFQVVDEIDRETASRVLSPISTEMNKLRTFYRESHARRVDSEKSEIRFFPPCMKEIIKNLEEGVNVSHIGRLAIASFMHKAGYSEDEIVQYFKNAPDFDENITRYQIKHISGEISGTEYTPPKCDTMRSNHLCFMDDDPLCHREWMKHPLTYLEVKRRNRKI